MKEKKEKIWLVCFQREEDWCNIESRRGTRTRRCIPPHSTTIFSQRRKAWLKLFASASTSITWWIVTATPLTNRCNSMCPSIPTLNQCFTSLNDISWKRIISMREESRAREPNFGNFSKVEEKIKVIKEIREYFRKFFHKKESFNFSHFRRKLKFHIFSCLKLCFKISKI